jgi:hypothetical protein
LVRVLGSHVTRSKYELRDALDTVLKGEKDPLSRLSCDFIGLNCCWDGAALYVNDYLGRQRGD